MQSARPKWYQTGPAIFAYVILAAIGLAYLVADQDQDAARDRSSRYADIDLNCLNSVDDDTALLFDSDIDVGRMKACDRSTDDIELPAELEAAIDDATGQSGSTFHGFDCLGDCSGHLAGFEWAARHGLDDPDNCGGKSRSFIEGCIAYARLQ